MEPLCCEVVQPSVGPAALCIAMRCVRCPALICALHSALCNLQPALCLRCDFVIIEPVLVGLWESLEHELKWLPDVYASLQAQELDGWHYEVMS